MTFRSKLAALGVAIGLAGLAGTFAVALPTQQADAHGGLTFPATRTYACYVDGRQGGAGGNLNPTNPMCATAWRENSYPFWNWFGNLLSNAGGRHQEIIPDGNLCGPGPDFASFRAAPASSWPTTQLQSGARITFQYNAWAPHPGTWSQYVTRDNWNPNTPLTWAELEPVPFDEVTNPPMRSGGPEGAEYYWNATLPNKQGRHIIYSIWQRSDSPEAFYNCSDVVFSGTSGGTPDTEAPTTPGTPSVGGLTGTTAQLSWTPSTDNVGVTGYEVRDADSGQVLGTSTTASTTLTGLSPQTGYTVRVVARDAAGNTSSPSPPVTFTTGGAGDTTCEVDYDLNSWSTGFSAEVTIHNDSTTTLNSWALEWQFSRGETVTQAWNATIEQRDGQVQAQNVTWNGTIPANGTASFGFLGEAPTGTATPGGFVLNGTPCRVA